MEPREHTSPGIDATPVGRATSRRHAAEDVWFSERWFDVSVNRLVDGQYHLTIAYHCHPRWENERDRPHLAAFVCRSPRDVHRILNDYDYRGHIQVDFVPEGRLDFVERTVAYTDRLVFDVRTAVRGLLPALRG